MSDIEHERDADTVEPTTDHGFDTWARDRGRELRRAAPADGLRAVVQHRQRQLRARAATTGGACAVVILAVIGVVVAKRNDGESPVINPTPTAATTAASAPAVTVAPTSASPSGSTLTTSPASTPATVAARANALRTSLQDVPPVLSVASAGMEEFDIPRNPQQMATDGTTLWILHRGGPISRRDATTGADLGTITGVPLGYTVERPEVAFGSLWVTTAATDTLWRIDAATGNVAASIKIPGDITTQLDKGGDHPETANVTASDRSVWVLTRGSERRFVEIDPSTNTVVRQVPAPSRAWTIRYGFGSLWTVNLDDTGETLVRVDPVDGRQLASIPSVGITDLGFSFGSIWSAELIGADEAITRYDPSTNQPTAEIVYPSAGVFATDFSFAGGYVWANAPGAGLTRIDPATNRIVARYIEATGGGGTATTDTAVWVVNTSMPKLYRLPLT